MATRVIKRSKQGSTGLAPQVQERIDLNEDFSDVSGDPNSEFALYSPDGETVGTEGDATYCYLWVKNDSDGTAGIPAFLAAIPPYEVVKYAEGETPLPRGYEGFAKPGENIVVRDQVLMRCSRALKEKRRRFEAAQFQRRYAPLANELRSDRDQGSTDHTVDPNNPGYAARERARLGVTGNQ